jgi:hypothetical protein
MTRGPGRAQSSLGGDQAGFQNSAKTGGFGPVLIFKN